jgi:hypothetical protein
LSSICVSVSVVVNENKVVGIGRIVGSDIGSCDEDHGRINYTERSGVSCKVSEESSSGNNGGSRSNVERANNGASGSGRGVPASEVSRRVTVRSDPSAVAVANSVVARSVVVASSRAVGSARRINLEERIVQLDEFLCFASDLWWFIRSVGDARIGHAPVAGASGGEVLLASRAELGKEGCLNSNARIWSRLSRDRIKRNWRRRRNQIRTVNSRRWRASENGGLTKNSLSFGQNSHRHFRNWERGELEGGELSLVEVTESLVVGWLNADRAVDSNLVVEVLLVIFSDLDVSESTGLDCDSIVSEANGSLVSDQEIGTTWQQSPSTPCAVFNFQARRRDSPIVKASSTDGNGVDGSGSSESFVDNEGLIGVRAAQNGLSISTLSEEWGLSQSIRRVDRETLFDADVRDLVTSGSLALDGSSSVLELSWNCSRGSITDFSEGAGGSGGNVVEVVHDNESIGVRHWEELAVGVLNVLEGLDLVEDAKVVN